MLAVPRDIAMDVAREAAGELRRLLWMSAPWGGEAVLYCFPAEDAASVMKVAGDLRARCPADLAERIWMYPADEAAAATLQKLFGSSMWKITGTMIEALAKAMKPEVFLFSCLEIEAAHQDSSVRSLRAKAVHAAKRAELERRVEA